MRSSLEKRVKEYWERKEGGTSWSHNWRYGHTPTLKYLHTKKNGLTLEVGCGTGSDAYEMLSSETENLILVDVGKKQLKAVKKNLRKFSSEYGLVECSADYLPFQDSIFDNIYSCGVIHHIPNYIQAINEVQRVARSGAKLTILVYNRDSIVYKEARHLAEDENVCLGKVADIGCPFTHPFSEEDIHNLFSQCREFSFSYSAGGKGKDNKFYMLFECIRDG